MGSILWGACCDAGTVSLLLGGPIGIEDGLKMETFFGNATEQRRGYGSSFPFSVAHSKRPSLQSTIKVLQAVPQGRSYGRFKDSLVVDLYHQGSYLSHVSVIQRIC